MTVYFDKRRGHWTYDFWRNGERRWGYCLDARGEPVTSRSAALQAEGVARRKAELELKIAKTHELTIAMAVAALTPSWALQANWTERQRWLKEIIAFFGIDTPIAEIDQAKVDDYKSFCQTQKIVHWKGGPKLAPLDDGNAHFWVPTSRARAAATVNLYLGTLRQIIERAGKHRDPETGRPVFEHLPAVKELPKAKRKARPMPDAVAADIMAIMPPHTIDAMMLTALFGFRRGEVFTLERHQIDWEAAGIRLHAEDVKDAEDVFLPASQFALGWLWCLDMEAERRRTTRLITWQRTRKDAQAQAEAPAMQLKFSKGAWQRARALMREKYGRTWRWHDLRAAFITHVALTSGPMAAQTLARHGDLETTQGYIEVADELRRIAAERVADRPMLKAVGGNPRHRSQTGEILSFDRKKKPRI